jgi:hypothetical protein
MLFVLLCLIEVVLNLTRVISGLVTAVPGPLLLFTLPVFT